MKRILTAVALLAVFWLVLQKTEEIVFVALVACGVALAMWECYALMEARGRHPLKLVGVGAGLGLAWSLSSHGARFGPGLPIVVLLAVALAAIMWRRDEPRAMLDDVVSTVFPLVFVGLTLSYTAGLRALPGEDGKDLPLLLLACVSASDIAALYVGTFVGRHRMAPILSPKKTWEGAIAGLAASVIAALTGHFWFYQRLPVAHAAAVGLLVGLAGIVGDLAESMLKRAAEVKDSSTLLPGHGGVLDRADSLLLAAPVLYFYHRFFLGVSP